MSRSGEQLCQTSKTVAVAAADSPTSASDLLPQQALQSSGGGLVLGGMTQTGLLSTEGDGQATILEQLCETSMTVAVEGSHTYAVAELSPSLSRPTPSTLWPPAAPPPSSVWPAMTSGQVLGHMLMLLWAPGIFEVLEMVINSC